MQNLWITYWILFGLLASLIFSVFFLGALLSFTRRSTWAELPVNSKILYALLAIFWPFTICVAISLYTIYRIIKVVFTLGKRAGNTLDKVMG